MLPSLNTFPWKALSLDKSRTPEPLIGALIFSLLWPLGVGGRYSLHYPMNQNRNPGEWSYQMAEFLEHRGQNILRTTSYFILFFNGSIIQAQKNKQKYSLLNFHANTAGKDGVTDPPITQPRNSRVLPLPFHRLDLVNGRLGGENWAWVRLGITGAINTNLAKSYFPTEFPCVR